MIFVFPVACSNAYSGNLCYHKNQPEQPVTCPLGSQKNQLALRPPDRCLVMASKIKEKLESRAGSLNRKPPWMKRKTFEALKKKYSEYRDIKYIKAKDKEFIKLYPELAGKVDYWM